MEDEMKILVTGGTGFIGSYLCERLMRNGHYLTVLTRSPEKYAEENAKNQQFIDLKSDLVHEVEKADVVINLAGENLFGKRWTNEVKKRLYNSRIELTGRLAEAMNKAENSPKLFISASGINYYGDTGDELLTEESGSGDDFLAKICIDWEKEARRAESAGVRVAIPRIAVVLEDDGGVIEKMKLPFLLFAGGPLGSGKQFMSWIHMHDLCSAIRYPIENMDISGPYNACSPNPVTMNEFAGSLGKVMRRPSIFKVPEFVLNIALGEAASPILSSVRAQPEKLQKAGFEFQFEDLEYALADIL